MTTKALSERERRFVEAFMGQAAGNGTEAARAAGYKGASPVLGVQSTRLLKKANVQAAIANYRQGLTSLAIADATERREILTAHARNLSHSASAIKAIDVLNKMDGIYIEKHDINATVSTAVRVIHEHRPA